MTNYISGRYSGLQIIRLNAPSRLNVSGNIAFDVPDYSGGPTPDSHGIPFYAQYGHLKLTKSTRKLRASCQFKKK